MPFHVVLQQTASDGAWAQAYAGNSGGDAETAFDAVSHDGTFRQVIWMRDPPHIKRATPAQDFPLPPEVPEGASHSGRRGKQTANPS